MNRQQKEAVVSDFKGLLCESEATFVINYQGLSVKNLQDIRSGLREIEGIFKVTKARLMKIAVNNSDVVDGLSEYLKDQIGLVFAKTDAVQVAKKLVEFSKVMDKLSIISGFFESRVISSEDIQKLALLPSREALLGMLACTMQAPIVNFARILNMLIIRFLYVLNQISEQKK
jgi:large subunit ribosomal protein L10